jgi:hypothetical protein
MTKFYHIVLVWNLFWFDERESRGRCINSNPIWLPFLLYFVWYILTMFSSIALENSSFLFFFCLSLLLYSCCWWYLKDLKKVLVILLTTYIKSFLKCRFPLNEKRNINIRTNTNYAVYTLCTYTTPDQRFFLILIQLYLLVSW